MPGVFRFVPSPGSGPAYFELVGSDGNQRWSSKDKIFRVTDVLQGSIAFSQRSTPLDLVDTTTIGACNADADTVLGYMKLASITLQPAQLSPFPAVGDWYYVSGTYLGHAGYGSDSVCAYTFLASGGVVSIEEQLAIYEIQNDVGQTFPYPAFTLDYELWVGTFL